MIKNIIEKFFSNGFLKMNKELEPYPVAAFAKKIKCEYCEVQIKLFVEPSIYCFSSGNRNKRKFSDYMTIMDNLAFVCVECKNNRGKE